MDYQLIHGGQNDQYCIRPWLLFATQLDYIDNELNYIASTYYYLIKIMLNQNRSE